MEAPDSRTKTTQLAVEMKQQVAKVVAEPFMVEDLLDFSEDDMWLSSLDEVTDASTLTTTVMDCGRYSSSESGERNLASGDGAAGHKNLTKPSLSGELCAPYDELAELEWLSNFVEESFSSDDLQNLHIISGVKSSNCSETCTNVSPITTVANDNLTTFASEKSPPVTTRGRTKRSRQPPCDLQSRTMGAESKSLPESELTEVPPLLPPVKAAKIGKKKDINDGMMPASDGRRCLHCATDKTPQWRSGPMGPKTLCNACGVRFKSGRLVPEYRPAASPTFVMSKHSNSHRKVLELRRKKELPQVHHQQTSQFTHHHHQTGMYDSVASSSGSAGDEFLIHHHLGPDYRQLI